MKKLSLILALVLILGTFAFPAFAEAATNEAKIGDVEYATLEEAVTYAAANGGTIELLKDAVIDSTGGINITPKADFTLNGNGHTITSNIQTANRATFYIQAKTVTFNNVVFETALNGSQTWGVIISKNANTNVILNGCTVNVRGTAGYGAYGFVGGGKLTLNNTQTTSTFKGFFFYNGAASAGSVEATNSTLIAPAIGDTTVATGLTFTQNNDPFSAPTVATVGTEKFSSLEKAISYAVANGGTVELLDDVTIASNDGMNVYSSTPCAFTLNGNGHTITSTIATAYRATLYVNGTVTINNVVFETTTSHANAWGVIASRGATSNVTLNGCTVNVRGTAGAGAFGMNESGKITLQNTTVTSAFPVFLDFANNGAVAATNSTATAPSLGIDAVAGLTFTQDDNPFAYTAAMIGTTKYATLTAAIEAVQNGETVKLMDDISGSLVINKANVSWTLDGNGKSINSTDSIALDIVSKSSHVTVKNLTVVNNHSGTGHGLALRVQNGTVTLDNCNLSTIGSGNKWGAAFLNSNGTLYVTNGTVLDGAKNPGVYVYDATGTCIVYDGTLKGNVIAYNNKGTLKMYGGKTVVGSTTTSYNPTLLDGASIRTTKGSNGIRFTTSISAELLAHINSLGATKVSYGTLIFKAESYKALGNATPAAAGWANGTYVDIAAKNGFMGDTENGPFIFNAALSNIKDANLDATFGAISYIEYTVGEEIIRVYSEYNTTDNNRKIKDVALNALKDVAAADTNGEYTKDGWDYKYELTYYYNANGEKVEGKAYSCYTAAQYAVVEEIYNRKAAN